jgi:hypothetical protein
MVKPTKRQKAGRANYELRMPKTPLVENKKSKSPKKILKQLNSVVQISSKSLKFDLNNNESDYPDNNQTNNCVPNFGNDDRVIDVNEEEMFESLECMSLDDSKNYQQKKDAFTQTTSFS